MNKFDKLYEATMNEAGDYFKNDKEILAFIKNFI
jgi:hypothetical protein